MNANNTGLSPNDDQATINAAWSFKNNKGEGFAIGDPESDGVREAIEAEGWTILHEGVASHDAWLARDENSSLIAVADANGPWATLVG